ncbi:glycine cleavage system aminomethyltransferase GcvT, partial [bacterium]
AKKKLVGVRMEAKRLIPQDAEVVVDGKVVGTMASGVVSPLLEAGIGTAFVDPSIKLGTAASIVLRGKEEPATIVNKRFYKRAS